MNALRRCSRCGRRYRGRGEWNTLVRRGVPVALICPACQSPEENAEAAINDATTSYSVDAFGRLIGTVKS